MHMDEQRDLFGSEEARPRGTARDGRARGRAKTQKGGARNAARAKHAADPPATPPLSESGRELAEALDAFTVEYLKGAYRSLTAEGQPKGNKAHLCEIIASLVDCSDETTFTEFFSSLPGQLQAAIERGAFAPFVDVKPLEREYGLPILEEDKDRYGYGYWTPTISGDSRMRLFRIVDEVTVELPVPFRTAFARWLPKPSAWEPGPSGPPERAKLRSQERIEEVLPLLYDEIGQHHDFMFDTISKSDGKRLQERCGVTPFPIAQRFGLYAGRLLAGFITAFAPRLDRRGYVDEGLDTSKLADPDELLRQSVASFFAKPKDIFEGAPGLVFENRFLLPHLSSRNSVDPYGPWPHSRLTFRSSVERMSGHDWFDVDELFAAAEYRSEPLSPFLKPADSSRLSLKGDRLELGSRTLHSDSWDRFFRPSGVLRRELVSRPVFRGYFYLFASLGLFEIAETEPPRGLERGQKRLPISPFDGLRAVRLTPLGAWCFGMTSERPERHTTRARVLADAELPILAIQGEALAERLFLDRVGTRIGPERYRVTEASFIAGCRTVDEIEERIGQFHRLVGDEPSGPWQEMIASIRRKSTIFTEGEQAVIFELPPDERIRSLFFTNPRLRSLAIKAEGGLVVCRAKDYRRLAKELASEGFHCPPKLTQ